MVVASQLNVKYDFGVKGDSIIDDTISMQNALNNGSNNCIYIPSGIYILSDILYLPDNITIIGEGIGRTILTTTADNILKLNKGNNISISGISFIVNNKKGILVNLAHINNLMINNCSFENSSDKGLQIQYSNNVSIINCIISNSLSSGIVLSKTSNIIISGCRIYNNIGCGISLTGIGTKDNGCNIFTVQNNYNINNGKAGIAITGYCSNGKIINNICNNNGINNPQGMGDGINGHRLNNVIILNNICNNNFANGIGLNGQDENGNTSCQNIIIENCTNVNNGNSGIVLFYTQNCKANQNICTNNKCANGLKGGGIYLCNSINNIIDNNNSYNNNGRPDIYQDLNSINNKIS